MRSCVKAAPNRHSHSKFRTLPSSRLHSLQRWAGLDWLVNYPAFPLVDQLLACCSQLRWLLVALTSAKHRWPRVEILPRVGIGDSSFRLSWHSPASGMPGAWASQSQACSRRPRGRALVVAGAGMACAERAAAWTTCSAGKPAALVPDPRWLA